MHSDAEPRPAGRDLPSLQSAMAGRAKFLVTGDADLLALDGLVRFRIVTLAGFLGGLGEA